MNKLACIACICLIGVSGFKSTCMAGQEKENIPIRLKAQDVLPDATLHGTNYTIESAVFNDGLINTYNLTTDYGPTTIESTSQLMIRLSELKALQVMEEVDRKGVFGDALVRGIKAPVQGVVELVQSPIETSKSIFKGAGRFLSNIGNSIVSDDPNQDNALKVALGYDVAKRQFAFSFDIDPYTTYQPVVDRLGEIARAAVAGGITPKAALAAVDSDLALGLRISGTAKGLKELVRDNAPNELHKINAEKMQKMSIPADLTDSFLTNYNYDPQEETLLVGELATMQDVAGRDVFFTVANSATDRTVAINYRIIAQMMAGYHTNVSPLEQILNIDGTLHVKTNNGVIALIVPVDYVFLTTKVDEKLNRLDERISAMGNNGLKEIWITGKMDGNALTTFRQKGWKVKENATAELIK